MIDSLFSLFRSSTKGNRRRLLQSWHRANLGGEDYLISFVNDVLKWKIMYGALQNWSPYVPLVHYVTAADIRANLMLRFLHFSEVNYIANYIYVTIMLFNRS